MKIGKDLIINPAQVIFVRRYAEDDTTYITTTAITSEDDSYGEHQPVFCPVSMVLSITDPHGEVFIELARQLELLSSLKPVEPVCPACQAGASVGPKHLKTCNEYCPF